MINGRLWLWGLAVMSGLLIAGCSEGQSVVEAEQAGQIMSQARKRFQLLGPLLDRAAQIERGEGAFRPVILNSRDGGGEENLTSADGWSKLGNHRMEAELLARAADVLRLSSGPVTLDVRALGARDVPGVPQETALVFQGAYPYAHSFFIAEEQRVEEFIVLRDARAPRLFEYELKVVAAGAQIRQTEGLVEVLDREGDAWMRLAPPFTIDARGIRRPAAVELAGTRLKVSLPGGSYVYPVLLDPGWTTTGKMSSNATGHVATRLTTGDVLVVGLDSHKAGRSFAERYNPTKGTWTFALATAREPEFTATLLSSGHVLAAGGKGPDGNPTFSSELYNPTTGTWAKTGDLYVAKMGHTATLLKSGKVLATGGLKLIKYCPPGAPCMYSTETSERTDLYTPSTGKWVQTGDLNTARTSHTATLLGSGKVLVVGGKDKNSSWLSSAELYDPASGKWTKTGVMAVPRHGHSATLLPSGKVLIAGGYNALVCKSAELYDPQFGSWTPIKNMKAERHLHTATLLSTGKVLVAGGEGWSSAQLSSAELFDPGSGTWTSTNSMGTARWDHTATLLISGEVLVVGGRNAKYSHLATAELYFPTSGLNCQKPADCANGQCVDGVCCDTSCRETCKTCIKTTNAGGTFGTCSNANAGTQDTYATTPCTGAGTCDGNGVCKKSTGQACTANSECALGLCVDSTCCDTSCTSTCTACNVSGLAGKCSNVLAGQGDGTCAGTQACDGKGSCKKANGQACTAASDCGSGYCVDKTCCDTACKATCKSCAVSGYEGTCTNIPKGQQDGNATNMRRSEARTLRPRDHLRCATRYTPGPWVVALPRVGGLHHRDERRDAA